MTDLIHRLPSEVSNHCYSFVGEHKLAKIIKQTIKHTSDSIERSNHLDHYVEDEFYMQYFALINLIKEVHGNYYLVFDMEKIANAISCSVYDSCYYCDRPISRQDLIDYFMECKTCNTVKLRNKDI